MQPASVTQLIRDGGLSDVACDIPAGMTLAEYRASRRAPKPRHRLRGRRRQRL